MVQPPFPSDTAQLAHAPEGSLAEGWWLRGLFSITSIDWVCLSEPILTDERSGMRRDGGEVGLHCMGSARQQGTLQTSGPHRLQEEDPQGARGTVTSSTDSALKPYPWAGDGPPFMSQHNGLRVFSSPILSHPWWTHAPDWLWTSRTGGWTSLGPSPKTRSGLGYWGQTRAQDLPFSPDET